MTAVIETMQKTGIWGKNVSLSLNFKQKKKSTKPQGSSDIIYT